MFFDFTACGFNKLINEVVFINIWESNTICDIL